MNEKESRFSENQQGVLTPRTGLRASNTLETLRPREINVPANSIPQLPLQGRGLPPIDFEDEVRKTDFGGEPHLPESARLGSPEYVKALRKQFEKPEAYNVLPVDWPTAQETMGLPETISYSTGYRARIEKLEEQMDGLLDRLAKFNFKASHKI